MHAETLIERLKSQDPHAFGELVNTYKDRVYNTCLGFVKNNEDAMDLSQEVFMEVHRSFEKFRGEAKLSTWVYRIATTKSLEHIRKHKRKKRFAFLTSISEQEDHTMPTAGDWVHPGVQLENKERAKVLFSAIDKLPDNQRIAFTLNKVEGLSYQEVGKIMERSDSSVESLMFRAKKNLKKILYNYYQHTK